MIRKVKYAYQRINHGFSDKDMWNADRYLARMYADILMWYVEKGMGIPSIYADTWDILFIGSQIMKLPFV
jgi:hypothetical protein